MMYELLTGKKPFGSGLRAVRHIVDGQYEPFPPFITQNPQFKYLSNQLINVIKSCLTVDVDKRLSADQLVEQCSFLCYQVSKRYVGNVKSLKHKKWGFITSLVEGDTFYHVESIYGVRPDIGESVMFSKYNGGGAPRALPVLKIKQ